MAKRPSKIDRLPEEVQTLIGELHHSGRTIDEIMAKLGGLDLARLGISEADMPSRAAVGRHAQGLDAKAVETGRQKIIAEAMVERGLPSRLMFTEPGTMATYYVSYAFVHAGRSGFGSCTTTTPLTSYKSLMAVREWIEQHNGFEPKSVVILNWTPLPDGEG